MTLGEIGDPRRVIVVTGAGGQLGTAFRKLIPDAVFLTRADLDLSHPEGCTRSSTRFGQTR